MGEADKGWLVIRIGVSGSMFLYVCMYVYLIIAKLAK